MFRPESSGPEENVFYKRKGCVLRRCHQVKKSWTSQRCGVQLWFGYLGKFRDSIGTLLRNTLKMTVADFGKTFLLAALVVAVLAGTYVLILLMPPLLPLLWAFYQILAGKLLSSIFRRYIPEEAPIKE